MAISKTSTLGGRPLLVPDDAAMPIAKGKANSFVSCIGPYPGRGWVLMLRSDLEALSVNSLQTLILTQSADSGGLGFGPAGLVAQVYILQAYKVEPSENGPNNAFLIEIADRRHLLCKWSCTNRNFNHISTSSTAYISDTLNAGSAWTWATLIDRLWQDCGLGSTPSFPGGYSPPAGNPGAMSFIGVNAWLALHDVLHKIGLTTALNPQTNAFSFVALAGTQADFTGTAPTPRVYDAAALSPSPLLAPEKIRVFFRFRLKDWGQEIDTTASSNHIASLAYSHDVTTGIAGAVAGTVLPLWDELPALVDHGNAGALTGSMITALQARAAETAAAWIQQYAGPNALRRQTIHQGLRQLVPGPQARIVAWRDRGNNGGTTTEVVSMPGIPEDVRDLAAGHPYKSENFLPFDLGRPKLPTWPRETHVVKCTNSTAADAGNRLYEGVLCRYISSTIGGTLTEYEAVFIRPIGAANPVAGEYYLARQYGLVTSSGAQTLACYVSRIDGSAVSPGTTLIRFQIVTALAPGGVCQAKQLAWTGSAYAVTGSEFLVFDPYNPGKFRGIVPDPASDGLAQGVCYQDAIGPTYAFTATNAADSGGDTEITATAHGLATGMQVVITGGTGSGLTGVNGTWTITVTDANHFKLDGSTFGGTYDSNSATVRAAVLTILDMEMPAEAIEATLTENMGASTANRASASLVKHHRGLNPGTTVNVWDASPSRWKALKSGNKVSAQYNWIDNKYYITSNERIKAQVYGKATQTIATTDATFTIEVERLIQDAELLNGDDTNPLAVGSTLTVHNRPDLTNYVFTGSNAVSKVYAEWDWKLGRWDAIWVTCPTS